MADLLEDFFETITGSLGVEPDHSDRGLIIEDGGHDGAISDHRQLNAVFFSLVKENREFVLAEKAGHLSSGGIRTGYESRNCLLIDTAGVSAAGHHVTFFIDQQVTPTAG